MTGEDLAAARAALPRVTRIQPGATWPTVTLEMDTGASLYLSADHRAALHALEADGVAVLVCWKPVSAVCAVPAALMPELERYFPKRMGQP